MAIDELAPGSSHEGQAAARAEREAEAVAAFAFGRARGVIEGCAGALGLPIVFLTPPTWKRLADIPPGAENKDLARTRAMEAYLMAANLAGGKEGLIGYLKKQAELENPSAFMTGLSKLLPSMLEGNPDAPLIVERVYYTREAD